MLLRTLARRSRLPRRGFVPAGLGMIIRLCRRRPIILSRWRSGTSLFGMIVWLCRRRPIGFRTIWSRFRMIGWRRRSRLVGLCRGRPIRFRTIWSRLRTIRRRCRRRLVRLRLRGPIGFRTIWIRLRTIRSCFRTIIRLSWRWPVRFSWSLIRSRRIAGPVRRLIRGRRLPRSRGIAGLVSRMPSSRRRRFSCRRYLHHRMRLCRRTQRLHLTLRDRFSRMRSQCLLLFRKRYGRRRRSLLGDYLPVRDGCRWRSYVTRGCRSCAQHAFPRWRDCNSSAHGSRCNLLCCNLHPRLRHRLCAGKGVLRNYHHRTLNIPVSVGHIRNVRGVVYDGRVVDGRYLGDVHSRIADVDPIHIRFADVIRGHINFPRP